MYYIFKSFQQMLDLEEAGETWGDEPYDGIHDRFDVSEAVLLYCLIILYISEVNQWSDYMKAYIHPKSIQSLPLKSGHSFDNYFSGAL